MERRRILEYESEGKKTQFFWKLSSLSLSGVRATDLSDGTAAAVCVRTSIPVACRHCLNEMEGVVGWSKVEMGKEEGDKNGIINIF